MSFLMSKTFNTLDELFLTQLDDLYDCEKRIIDALPRMEQVARSADLKRAFREHLDQTKNQVRRLEDAFHQLHREWGNETCNGIKGILDEGEKIVDAEGDADVRDAGLIAAAQRVEHYEIAAYGTARTFAKQLGYDQIASLLQESLNEEGETDKRLTVLAERSVNVKARA